MNAQLRFRQMVVRRYRQMVPVRVRTLLWMLRAYLFYDAPERADGNLSGHFSADLYRLFGRTIVKTTLHDGSRIYVDLRDRYLGSSLFRGWNYEPEETALLSRLLRPGMRFVDIGANIGYHSLLAARLAGPTGRVLCFEPDPHTYLLLVASLRLNGYAERVVARNVALGSAPGQAMLWKSDVNLGDHRLAYSGASRPRTAVPVTVDTFDRQVRTSGLAEIDVLKIDVQGFEAKVFYGMSETLSTIPPRMMMMEFWPHGIQTSGDDPEKLLRWLMDYGYRLGLFAPDHSVHRADIGDVFATLPVFDPAIPDACYVNIVLTRND